MKEKLTKCRTWQESQDVFNETSNDEIQEFINALKNVVKFIDLTMRDEFLLQQAESYLKYYRS